MEISRISKKISLEVDFRPQTNPDRRSHNK